MSKLWLVAVFLSLGTTLGGMCPTKCSCYLDQRGRKTVLCKEGGLVGPLNLNNVSLDTEVIKITAPDDNTNLLTMSPVFQSYRHLEEIHITKSNIPQLGMHFFWGLSKLDVLNLSQNNISQPLDHNFRGLDQLKELYLDDNRIQSLPSGTFRYLRELKVLSIQRNRITDLVNRIFLEISKLRALKLSGNNLRELHPEVFRDVEELRQLECRGCALTKINPHVHKHLPNLVFLDVGDNQLTTIRADDLRHLTNLKQLKLDGNQLQTIQHDAFQSLTSLRKLVLARNWLKHVSGLSNLTELDLSFNRLRTVNLESVEVLNLSGNPLDEEGLNDLAGLEMLKELRLAQCGLTHFNFPLSGGLEVLDVSHNHITSLPSSLPFSLRLLDLSDNLLKGIDEYNMEKLDGIKHLLLQGNPWSCDLCHVIPLLDRTNKSVRIQELTCAAPYTVRGRTFGMLDRSELVWCSSYGSDYFFVTAQGNFGLIAAAVAVCLLLLTVLAVFAALCYGKRHAARYYTNEEKLDDGDSFGHPLFCDGELTFKFPLELGVSTVEEVRKGLANGT